MVVGSSNESRSWPVQVRASSQRACGVIREGTSTVGSIALVLQNVTVNHPHSLHVATHWRWTTAARVASGFNKI